MDDGKLERMQNALDEWVQQHPEEVKRIQELVKPAVEFLNSPEWHAFWPSAKATISGSDKTRALAWAEDRIGIKPDSVLRVHLSPKELGEATPRETFERVDGRGSRLRPIAKVQGIGQRLGIRGGIKRFPSLDQALKALALEDQTREQVLKEHILSLAYKAQEEAGGSLSDAELVRIITGQLRRDTWGAQTTRREELLLLAEFAEREVFLKQALERGRQAGLTPREFEVYKLFVENPGIKNREVAARLGISVGTVGALKSRTKKTLNTA